MGNPSYVIGSPVSGDDFWDREEIIEDIRDSLRCNSVLLTAPRRFGKTSVMYYLQDNASHGWDYLYSDVEGGETPEALINSVLVELSSGKTKAWEWVKDTGSHLQDMVDEIRIGVGEVSAGAKIADSYDENWQDRAEKLFSELERAKPRVVIMVDELPVLIKYMYENDSFNGTEEFLHWFRSLRQSRDGIKWVVGGSIGLGSVLQYVGVSREVMNDLERETVHAFSQVEAKGYIRALIENKENISNIEPEVLDKFLEVLGAPVPLFVQILVKETMSKVNSKEELCEEIIRETYKQEFLSPTGDSDLKYYDERIEKKFQDNQVEIVRDILTHTAREGVLTNRDAREIYKEHRKSKVDREELSSLLMTLEHDYYLSKERGTEQYEFAAKPIQDWWLENKCI